MLINRKVVDGLRSILMKSKRVADSHLAERCLVIDAYSGSIQVSASSVFSQLMSDFRHWRPQESVDYDERMRELLEYHLYKSERRSARAGLCVTVMEVDSQPTSTSSYIRLANFALIMPVQILNFGFAVLFTYATGRKGPWPTYGSVINAAVISYIILLFIPFLQHKRNDIPSSAGSTNILLTQGHGSHDAILIITGENLSGVQRFIAPVQSRSLSMTMNALALILPGIYLLGPAHGAIDRSLLILAVLGTGYTFLAVVSMRAPDFFGLHLRYKTSISAVKVMEALWQLEERYPAAGMALLPVFFSRKLRQHEVCDWYYVNLRAQAVHESMKIQKRYSFDGAEAKQSIWPLHSMGSVLESLPHSMWATDSAAFVDKTLVQHLEGKFERILGKPCRLKTEHDLWSTLLQPGIVAQRQLIPQVKADSVKPQRHMYFEGEDEGHETITAWDILGLLWIALARKYGSSVLVSFVAVLAQRGDSMRPFLQALAIFNRGDVFGRYSVSAFYEQEMQNITQSWKWFGTPVQAALISGNDAMAEWLLEVGNTNIGSEGGHFGTTLQIAISNGLGKDLIKKLTAAGADVNGIDPLFGTVLQVASHYDSEADIKYLLDHGAEVNRYGGCFNTPLLYSAFYGDLLTCELLVRRNADVTARSAYNFNMRRNKRSDAIEAASVWTGGVGRGKTSLALAISEGHTLVANLLVANNAVIESGSESYTLIVRAITKGDRMLLRVIRNWAGRSVIGRGVARQVQRLRTLTRAKVEPGLTRFEWICSCGDLLFGDYRVESNEDAGRFRQFLDTQRPTQSPNTPATSASSQGNTNTIASSSSTPPAAAGPGQIPPQPTTSSSAQVGTTSGQSSQNPLDNPSLTQYFELCATKSSRKYRLGETFLGNRVIPQSDTDVFAKIKPQFDAIRRKGLYRIFFKPSNIRWEKFVVQENGAHVAPIGHESVNMPPEEEVRTRGRYEYGPCPWSPKEQEPMDWSTFSHYLWDHVQARRNDLYWTPRLPKKLSVSVEKDVRDNIRTFEWGALIIETPNRFALSLLSVAIVSFSALGLIASWSLAGMLAAVLTPVSAALFYYVGDA